MGAFANQRLLGNKAFVKKLITTEPSTAEKLIAKIREIRENLMIRNPSAKAQLELVRKAEKLFMQGLSEAGGTIDATGKIHIANKEDDEGEIKRLANPKSVDNDTSEGYNDSEYMNRRGWAVGVLSREDRSILRGNIAEAEKRGFEAHPRLSDGSYLFEVNNKIVLVSGEFENPFYDGVIDINTDNATTASTIRKDIENATNGKGCTSTSFLETVEKLYGTEVLMVYNRSDWGSFGTDQRQSYPTRPDGYKDFGYSREQQYGRRSVGEAENSVTSDSRLAPPSFAPVRQEYTDITGNKRYVLEYKKGEYGVWGTYSPRPYDLHLSISVS